MGNENRTDPAASKGALEGIRVLDWTQQIAASAANLLAALGAEVIHIERLGSGDPIRGFKRWAGLDYQLPDGRNVLTEIFNRNKKSLAINLELECAKKVVYQLVSKSDVFVTNFSKNRIDEFGLDYRTLQKHNSKIIYASATLYGPKGPDCEMPGYDFLGQARSGLTSILGENSDAVVPGPPNISDQITAMALGYGIMTALLTRERLGIGQEVNVSQLGAMISIVEETALGNLLFCGREQERFVRSERRNPISNCYKCKDGRWIFITMINDEHMHLLGNLIGMPDLSKDPRFSSIHSREENRHALIAILDAAFSTKTADEWQEIARGYRAALAVANRLEDLQTDPQVLANNYIIEYDHPVLGPTKYPGYPFHLNETPAACKSPAPEAGQHTEEILIDLCGYSWNDIEELQNAGAI